MRRLGLIVVSAAVLAASAAPAWGQVPPTPERSKWFAYNDDGYWSKGTYVRVDQSCGRVPQARRLDCSVEAFRERPFVVIAIIDTGINPYHEDFRAPEFVHHPSKYIEGYPSDTPALRPSLSVADKKGYEAARTADQAMWLGTKASQLYWFPGTRIIGGISMGGGGAAEGYQETRILDDEGHGTGTSSVAAGRFYGSNPNALIVMVESLGEASLEWATSQEWIDIVSNSWGNRANLPLGDPSMTKTATERGQSIVFSAGNGATNTNSSTVFPADGPVEDPCKCKTPDSDQSILDPWSGPSWQITVGAASPINGQAHWWHSIPVDVSSFGSKWRAASAFGVKARDEEETRDFGGTSCAAPTTAGVLSSIIERARFELGDTVAGQKKEQVVAAAKSKAGLPGKGPLSDGALTRTEAEELLMKTAAPVPADPEKLTWDYAVRPTTPLYYVYQGYGVVTRDSKDAALKALMGKELPDRAEVDAWIEFVDTIRDAFWDNYPP